MATIAYTAETIVPHKVFRITWRNLRASTNDVGVPFSMPDAADVSVQVTGNFGTGGSVRMEGSLNEVDYAPLTDPQGNNLDITGAKMEAISELAMVKRPRMLAGDAPVDLTVTMLVRKP